MFRTLILLTALISALTLAAHQEVRVPTPKPGELWVYVPAATLNAAPHFASLSEAEAAAEKASYATPGVQLLVLEIEGSFFVPAPPCNPMPCP